MKAMLIAFVPFGLFVIGVAAGILCGKAQIEAFSIIISNATDSCRIVGRKKPPLSLQLRWR